MRRGLTLIEVLVVVGIMLLLVAIAIPAVNFLTDRGRIRAGAALAHSELDHARYAAIEDGDRRWNGVALLRDPNNPRVCTSILPMRKPALYAGEEVSSQCRIQVFDTTSGSLRVVFQEGHFHNKLIKPGDRIQFNSMGHRYFITDESHDSNSDGFVDFDLCSVDADGWYTDGFLYAFRDTYVESPVVWPDAPTWSDPQTFQIERQMQPQPLAPTVLAGNVIIDLTASGGDGAGMSFIDAFGPVPDPIVIAFTSNGSLGAVYCGYHSLPPTSPVFLLVGTRDRVPDAGGAVAVDDGLANWRVPENRWVTIAPQTGTVYASEVAVGTDLTKAREFARYMVQTKL